MRGGNQQAQDADIHCPACMRYHLLSIDGVTGTKFDGKANSASTFWPIEGAHRLTCSVHRSSTKMNLVS